MAMHILDSKKILIVSFLWCPARLRHHMSCSPHSMLLIVLVMPPAASEAEAEPEPEPEEAAVQA